MHVITGMHRSGTSLVAKLFFEAGVNMGDPDTFYRTDQWNPDGYYEQADLRLANIRLLHGPWGRLSYLKLPSDETILKRAEKQKGGLAAMAHKYHDVLVKDPRFCLTLRAWLRHSAFISRLLVCLREPIETARSLQRRNKITVGLGLKIWLVHFKRLLGILEQATSIPVHYVLYGNLMNPEKRLQELGAAFDFFGYDFSPGELLERAKRGIKNDRHHHQELGYDYSSEVRAVWRELQERHHQQLKLVKRYDLAASTPPD